MQCILGRKKKAVIEKQITHAANVIWAQSAHRNSKPKGLTFMEIEDQVSFRIIYSENNFTLRAQLFDYIFLNIS